MRPEFQPRAGENGSPYAGIQHLADTSDLNSTVRPAKNLHPQNALKRAYCSPLPGCHFSSP
jgi:hypothetical protein